MGNKVLEMLSEPDGKLSMSRVLIILIILGYLTYAGILTINSKTLPDIPYGLAGLITVLYGVNKITTAVGGK